MNSILILIPTMVIVLLSFVSMAFLLVWTYRDAKARGLNAVLWTLVVLLAPGLIGLIIYLAVGRNQSSALCTHCGNALSADDEFCRKCGASAKGDGNQPGPRPIPKGGNRGPLIGFFICLGLILLMVIALIATAALTPLIYRHSGTAEFGQVETLPARIQDEAERIVSDLPESNVSIGVLQTNIGGKWSIRFALLSGTYDQKFDFSEGQSLVVNSEKASGMLQLVIANADGSVSETHDLSGGEESFSLSAFAPGTIHVTLIAEAKDGSMEITVK